MKNTLVVTHERAGTHLTINIINNENNGNFKPIGKLPRHEKHDLEHYIQYANLSMLYEYYQPNLTFKSHHQVFFFENNIDQLFDFVHSGKNIFGKDKVLLRLLHKYKIKRNSVIYVGDETRDIEALKRIKIPIIAVSWGFNSHSILEKFNPNALIDDPRELLGKINDLSESPPIIT